MKRCDTIEDNVDTIFSGIAIFSLAAYAIGQKEFQLTRYSVEKREKENIVVMKKQFVE